jgi:hypothetical protein
MADSSNTSSLTIGGGTSTFSGIVTNPNVVAATTPIVAAPSLTSENSVSNNMTIGTNPPPATPVAEKEAANVNQTHQASIQKAWYNNQPDSLKDLEQKVGLTTQELTILKSFFSRLNDNYWYLLLCFLVYGFDYHVMTAKQNPDHAQAHVDQNFIRDFKSLAGPLNPTILNIIKKTPAYKKGCFDDVGYFGVTHGVNSNKQPANPMSGPTKQAGTSLVERLLNTVNKGINSALEQNVGKARTQAYLSLPATAFASFQKAIAAINGIMVAFEALLRDIYQGVIQLVQQIYAVINGIIAAIQYYILSLINKYIIPIDLLCLILELLESFFGDSQFYSSLFNQSAFLNQYTNQFQSFMNTNNLAGNVLGSPQSHFPPQVNQIINMVNQIGLNPSLGTGMMNYGYHQSLISLQANLMGQIISKYGPNFAALSPMGQNQNGNVSPFPPAPSTFNYNTYVNNQGTATYVNNMPHIPQTINITGISNVPNPFAAFNTPNAGFNNIGNDLNNIGTSFSNLGSVFTGNNTPKK